MRLSLFAGTTTCAALLSALAISQALRAETPAAPVTASAAAGDPNPEFDALLARLSAKADQYLDYALGFTCEESIVRSKYDPERGSFRRRDREVYDYLFERSSKSGRLGEIRDIIEENGKPVRRSTRYLDLEVPPSYAWSQMFAKENRGRFNFRPAGRVLKGYRLLAQIDFVGGAAVPGKEDIFGWSGRASVDSGTLNLHMIEAEPSGQSARIEAERLKYQRAFEIMGVPLASRPKSRTLNVRFSFDNKGLTYPTETMLVKSVYVRSAEMGLEEKIVLRYRAYRFFVTGAEQNNVASEPAAPDPNFSDETAPEQIERFPGEAPDPNQPR